MTKSACEFVTPLSAAALSGHPVHTELFSLTEEAEMGHIRLSRAADLIVVAPATADILARMAAGMADDLAATVLLATDKPVMVAPSMNVMMWAHAATQANVATLRSRGILQVGPDAGDLACHEVGGGRMAEPLEIVASIEAFFTGRATKSVSPLTLPASHPLAGRRAIVTSGPTFEPVDPVRFIGNRSSGKQGHAIAGALARLGAETILISGPSNELVPPGVRLVAVETAQQMLDACEAALPADIAVCAAAVADWRVADAAPQKLKKGVEGPPVLHLVENPDILASLAQRTALRPRLVVGFAAETQDVVEAAISKRERKRCDWIVANDVSTGTGTFGGDQNTVHLVTETGVEHWPRADKIVIAERLAQRIADTFAKAPIL
jgi:phosphopantothenoylcysteine decarboxylase/phosphopantothenate--cysteine ligase